jgi:hypothetical protein
MKSILVKAFLGVLDEVVPGEGSSVIDDQYTWVF